MERSRSLPSTEDYAKKGKGRAGDFSTTLRKTVVIKARLKVALRNLPSRKNIGVLKTCNFVGGELKPQEGTGSHSQENKEHDILLNLFQGLRREGCCIPFGRGIL